MEKKNIINEIKGFVANNYNDTMDDCRLFVLPHKTIPFTHDSSIIGVILTANNLIRLAVAEDKDVNNVSSINAENTDTATLAYLAGYMKRLEVTWMYKFKEILGLQC